MVPTKHRAKLHRALNIILDVLNYPYKKEEARGRLETAEGYVREAKEAIERNEKNSKS
jgi:hypothetical protein